VSFENTLANDMTTLACSFFDAGSEWFWGMTQAIVVAVTLGIIAYQVRLQRFAQMTDVLARLDEKWNSDFMRTARKETCGNFAKAETNINKPEHMVCSFFEEVGLYVKRGIFDRALVWEFYSFDIAHYWPMLEEPIRTLRTKFVDKSFFEHFEELHRTIKSAPRPTTLDIPAYVAAEKSNAGLLFGFLQRPRANKAIHSTRTPPGLKPGSPFLPAA
jgi:hypothetical protein